jgi:hypothetical protein
VPASRDLPSNPVKDFFPLDAQGPAGTRCLELCRLAGLSRGLEESFALAVQEADEEVVGHPVGAPSAKAARSEEDKIESAYRFLLADLMPFGKNARIGLEHHLN